MSAALLNHSLPEAKSCCWCSVAGHALRVATTVRDAVLRARLSSEVGQTPWQASRRTKDDGASVAGSLSQKAGVATAALMRGCQIRLRDRASRETPPRHVGEH
uniref:Uncharacterized protein n=1 Tax=Pelagomonas calceolata TaxID=35677 RepID=A0A6S8V403_9STRA